MAISRTTLGTITLLIIATLQLSLFIVANYIPQDGIRSYTQVAQLSKASLLHSKSNSNTEEYIPLLFDQMAPSVLYIDTVKPSDGSSSKPPQGGGSGFVWDHHGHVVTNYHVVQNTKLVHVTLLTEIVTLQPPPPANDERALQSPITQFVTKTYTAKVVATDPIKDIALLALDNVPKHHLHPITLGSSSTVQIGQAALAVGNPFGLDHSLTAGIISGLNRKVRSPSGRPISKVIQTDAAMNPGNSGGPLFDNRGAMIGMNTAIYSPSGASAGVGFAIPIDTVKEIVAKLLKDGKVTRASLGVSILESEGAAASLGIKKGVLVVNVPITSSAHPVLRGTLKLANQNMVLGDVIIQMDEHEIETEEDMFFALENYEPGDKVTLVVERTIGQWSTGKERRTRKINVGMVLVESVEKEKEKRNNVGLWDVVSRNFN